MLACPTYPRRPGPPCSGLGCAPTDYAYSMPALRAGIRSAVSAADRRDQARRDNRRDRRLDQRHHAMNDEHCHAP
eukprot:5569967-Pyramimonas_sp.AAC.2